MIRKIFILIIVHFNLNECIKYSIQEYNDCYIETSKGETCHSYDDYVKYKQLQNKYPKAKNGIGARYQDEIKD